MYMIKKIALADVTNSIRHHNNEHHTNTPEVNEEAMSQRDPFRFPFCNRRFNVSIMVIE